MTTATETLRVLVVDDEPNIVDVISMALRDEGFEVAVAGTGKAALAAVETFRPNLMAASAGPRGQRARRAAGPGGCPARRRRRAGP